MLNQKLYKIEQKIDYLLEKEKYKITIKDYPRFPKNTQSLLKQVLTESVWKRNHMITTEEGININQIIQPGLDNPEHPIGVVALSKDCYNTFDEILVSIAQSYHSRNIRIAKYEKENYKLVNSLLNNMEEIFSKFVLDVEITSNRNLNEYLFSGAISRNDRRDVARNILQMIKIKENEVFDEAGKFLSLESKILTAQDQNQYYRSCGFYRDWPDGRFIYVNNNDTLSLISNEEDHVKIFQKNGKDSNISKYLISYFSLLDVIDMNACYDDNLGYVNSIPINLGSGTYFKVQLSVTSENRESIISHFKNIADLKVKELDNSIEISNNSSFYNFSAFLIEIISIKDKLK